MALVKCTDCGAEISAAAVACPKCGAKPPKRTKLSTWVVGAVMLMVVSRCVLDASERTEQLAQQAVKSAPVVAAQTPAEKAVAARAATAVADGKALAETQFQRAVIAAKTVKRSTKNPASFELTGAVRTDKGAICIEYSGTNSFNATVPGYAVLTPDNKLSSNDNAGGNAAWNKHCARQRGENMTHIKYAL